VVSIVTLTAILISLKTSVTASTERGEGAVKNVSKCLPISLAYQTIQGPNLVSKLTEIILLVRVNKLKIVKEF
jgi:hypothetical protein